MGFSKTFFLFFTFGRLFTDVSANFCRCSLLQKLSRWFILRVGASHVAYNIEILIEENRICSQHIVFVTQKYSVARKIQ